MQHPSHRDSGWKLWTTVCLSLMCLCVVSACKKDEKEDRTLSVRDKLLGTWRRNQRANDWNENGRVDSAEINRAKETDTLFFSLVPDATYTRTLMFRGEKFPESGTWHLQREDQEIVLQPSTSTSHVDTFRLDTVSQQYFMHHTFKRDTVHYYESFVRP